MSSPLAAMYATLVRRLPRRARAALLTVHVAASAGWLGLDGALVALEVIGLHSSDPALRTGISVTMAAIACWILIPLVFASLCSGLVLAVGTSWGLARHWWLLAKSGISLVLTVTGVALIVPRLPHVLAGEGEPIQVRTLALRSAALLLLLIATGLSVVKPWGKTRLAWARSSRTSATTVPVSRTVRPPAAARVVRTDASDDIHMEHARSAQLHALRALHGQRGLPAAPEEAGARGCRVLVIGSRTWIDPGAGTTTNTAAPARPQGRAVARSRSSRLQRPSQSVA